jgi:hypothetical protein
MNIQNEMQSLLQKKMDRRDFLKHVGIGFAAILGIGTLIRAMSSMNNGQKQTVGYSAGAYGGEKPTPTK